MDDGEGPVVTGISPTVGLPGTKVTIRGENLGENKDDVIGMKGNYLSVEFIIIVTSQLQQKLCMTCFCVQN